MKANIKSVLLASGGMDSTTLAFWLISKKIDFVPVFIDYGQHCVATEFRTLTDVLPKRVQKSVIRISIKDVYRNVSSGLIREINLWKESITAHDLYLPYRNLLLLSTGAAFAQARGYRNVYAGFINSNHAKEIDCSANFFESLSGLLSDYGTVSIRMPFRNKTKLQVARTGIKLAAPIGQTFSCQVASKVPCGACPNCVDRLEALRSIS